jgi:hypothetical protein
MGKHADARALPLFPYESKARTNHKWLPILTEKWWDLFFFSLI